MFGYQDNKSGTLDPKKMTTDEKVEAVKQLVAQEVPITKACRRFELSRGWFYVKIAEQEKATA